MCIELRGLRLSRPPHLQCLLEFWERSEVGADTALAPREPVAPPPLAFARREAHPTDRKVRGSSPDERPTKKCSEFNRSWCDAVLHDPHAEQGTATSSLLPLSSSARSRQRSTKPPLCPPQTVPFPSPRLSPPPLPPLAFRRELIFWRPTCQAWLETLASAKCNFFFFFCTEACRQRFEGVFQSLKGNGVTGGKGTLSHPAAVSWKLPEMAGRPSATSPTHHLSESWPCLQASPCQSGKENKKSRSIFRLLSLYRSLASSL